MNNIVDYDDLYRKLRIHRSNLLGMGVLPLQFINDNNAETLGILGDEVFYIEGISDNLYPNKKLKVTAKRTDGSKLQFEVIARLDNIVELEYYVHGGILNMMLRNFLNMKD